MCFTYYNNSYNSTALTLIFSLTSRLYGNGGVPLELPLQLITILGSVAKVWKIYKNSSRNVVLLPSPRQDVVQPSLSGSRSTVELGLA